MLNAVVQVFLGWVVLWDFRNVRQWDLASIVEQFVLAIMTYFVCIFAAPASDDDLDLVALYERRRRPFYISVLVLYLFAVASNLSLLESDPSLFLHMNELSLVSLVPIVLPLCTRAAWAQWIGGLGMLAFAIAFTFEFAGTLA
jgi:hypothetical protein